jgi:alanyl-tRNA synthetase
MLRVVTERLYYSDGYLTEFGAQVVEVSADGRRVYLDRTAFYPSSGGQPSDLGWLGGEEVVEVIDEDDRIAHVTALPVGSGPVKGKIHWPRRYDHMQQHSGQHLLSAVFTKLFSFPTLSFHMGDEVSTIELGSKELTDKQIDEAESLANEEARSGVTLHIGFEEAGHAEGLRKQSERSGTLRIIEIEGIDKSACGGTHVRSLAETLPLQIRKLERVRGNVRLDFVCGCRAGRRAKRDYRMLQELARQSAAPIDKLADRLAALTQRLGEAEKERQRLADSLARREGVELYAATTPSVDGIRRAVWDVEEMGETVRARALAYSAGARSVVLVLSAKGAAGRLGTVQELARLAGSAAGTVPVLRVFLESAPPAGVLIACSGDSGMDAGVILKQTLAEFGGKGGGSATLAQGSIGEPAGVRALAGKLGIN